MRTLIVAVLAGAAAVTGGIGMDTLVQAGKPQMAIFAGGCFWTMQAAFENVYGVIQAVSGYTGGTLRDPSYETYASAGHVEAVKVTWDPARVTYQELLDTYWHHINPTDGGGQFMDRGYQYRPVVFYSNDQQKAEAETSMAALAKSGKLPGPIAVRIEKAAQFYLAEAYHQDYPKKNPDSYHAYFQASGRREFFLRVWGPQAVLDPGAPPAAGGGPWSKPSQGALKKVLNALQFEVTQHDGTEPPFRNEYFHNEQAGIYVDVVSGEPLFSSTDKFDSGTGWPSFTRPLAPGNIVLRVDRSLGMERTEVRSRYANSHLGHLFNDGPAPTGLRYCMNSASLRFVPAADLAKDGYGQFVKLFNR